MGRILWRRFVNILTAMYPDGRCPDPAQNSILDPPTQHVHVLQQTAVPAPVEDLRTLLRR